MPPNFPGSPRFMMQCFMDSMTIVRSRTRPTFFVTFTANPKWAEIVRELGSCETAFDRPDLVTRVFHLKLIALLRDLTELHYFGRCNGYVWTIEYQKRGLPHAHILLFLVDEDRRLYYDAAAIDRVIYAELPGVNLDPTGRLRSVVARQMLHGPYGGR